MNKQLRRRLPSRSSQVPAQARRPAGFLACLLLAQVLAGCDGVTATPPPVNTPPTSRNPPPFDGPSGHGHFRGTATIGDDLYHAEALLTVDGELRLFVGGLLGPTSGPITGAGLAGELLDPGEAKQFSGLLEVSGDQGAAGAGLVIGEVCAAPDVGRFCGESAPAEATMTDVTNGNLAGEIRVATSAGDEIWLLDLSAWSTSYPLSGAVGNLGGTFTEELAQFAEAGDVVISIDGAGRLFFQGPATGCTGNGALTPHLDGEFHVYDVDLLIENCNATYDFLNNEYSGLATETQDGYWDFVAWLLIFVSTPDGVESPAAITMYAIRDGWDY